MKKACVGRFELIVDWFRPKPLDALPVSWKRKSTLPFPVKCPCLVGFQVSILLLSILFVVASILIFLGSLFLQLLLPILPQQFLLPHLLPHLVSLLL